MKLSNVKKYHWVISFQLIKAICSIGLIASIFLPWLSFKVEQFFYKKTFIYFVYYLYGEELTYEGVDGTEMIDLYLNYKTIFIIAVVFSLSLYTLVLCIKRIKIAAIGEAYADVVFNQKNAIHIVDLIITIFIWIAIFKHEGFFHLFDLKAENIKHEIGLWLFLGSIAVIFLIDFIESIYYYHQINNIEDWDE